MTKEQLLEKLLPVEKPEFSKVQISYLQDKIIGSIACSVYLLEKGFKEGRIEAEDIKIIFKRLSELIEWAKNL